MALVEKCIICGEQPFYEAVNRKQQTIFSSWKRKCSKSISDVLFGSGTEPLTQYFNIGNYCHICQQIARELNFTNTILKALQNKIDFLSRCLRKRLFENYQNFEKKSEESLIEERLQTFRDKDADLEKRGYNETVEVLYTAASRFCGDLDLLNFEEDMKMKFFPYASSNYVHVKTEPTDYEYESDYNSSFDGGLESRSSYEKILSADQIKTDENEDQPENEINGSNLPNRCSKRKAVARIKRSISADSSDNEAINEVESAVKRKLREKYEKKNKARREKRRNSYVHKKLPCTYENCKIAFTSEEKREMHIRQIHLGEKKPFQCPKCLKRFKCGASIKMHMINIHFEGRDHDYSCKFCGKGYKDEEELKTHYAGAHQGPHPFKCAFCDKMCTNATDLHKHVADAHSNYKRPQCDICKRFCASLSVLKIHKLMHNDPELQHKCEICNRIFATPQRLKCHKECHNEKAVFVCEFCGKSFRHKRGLQTHTEYHTKEKRFKCKICGMGFIKPGACRKHEVTHSGIKEFVCQICGRAFSLKYNLTDHEKIHQKEKDPTIVIRKRHKQKKQDTKLTKQV